MKNALYSFTWRIHFYAGLIVLPFLIILALSGSVYLFRPQLDKLLYPSLVNISPVASSVLSETLLTDKIKKKYPEATLISYHSPITPAHSAQFDISINSETLSVFYNPYTGNFLGERKNADYIQEIARKIHGELLIGAWGDRIVELAACWALILLISGLYLSWPRSAEKIWGFIVPRLNLTGRAFWRDLHVSSGIYGGLIIFFLILTGLPWSGIWGNKILHVWEQYPEKMFSNIPQSQVLTETLNKDRINVVAWAAEKVEIPASTPNGNSIGLSSAIEIALKEQISQPINVTFPNGVLGVYTVSAVTGDPKKERLVHLDQYSGKVLTSVGYSDYSPLATAVQYGISLHEGKYFGLANQLLGLFACLMLITLSVSGAILWWKRKPSSAGSSQASFQKLTAGQKTIVIFAALFFGIIFPLVGLSLMAVVILEMFRRLLRF